jgi:hypothetical protein
MMDTELPRLPGDVGHAATWPFPVHFRVVKGAAVRRVIRELGPRELLQPIIEAAQELDRIGVSVITTSGGYLALFQRELQAAVRATMLSSSLLQVPWVASLLPAGERVGILTMEARSLTPDHLSAVGVAPATRTWGRSCSSAPTSHLSRTRSLQRRRCRSTTWSRSRPGRSGLTSSVRSRPEPGRLQSATP